MTVRPGIEQLCSGASTALQGRRLGLLCNQASTDRDFVHSLQRCRQAFPGQLVALFSPQHGFFCEKQDNMIESDHGIEPESGLPLYSLYGETRRPHPWMLEEIDVLLVDLVDVGTRVYTFIWTVALCLQAAAEAGIEVIVLDRPNPIGGHAVEGNLLQEEWRSFVGMLPVPMRHGLSVGEMALLCNRELSIAAKLSVLPAAGWHRRMTFPRTGLPWVFPSPNMPTYQTALVYPGQVVWEGAKVSEGRGTTLPFELFGAPWIDHREVLDAVASTPLPGCRLRPVFFAPTSNKFTGQDCAGFHIHVIDEQRFMPYRTGLTLLQALLRLYPEQFRYSEPPYEYEFERLPMDLILGDRAVREALEQGVPVLDIEAGWREDLRAYRQRLEPVLLYE